MLVNGDSWTGGWIHTPEFKLSWADHLHNMKLGTVHNIANVGGSNARIFRTTVEYLLCNPKPDVVIIGWSSIDRAELPLTNVNSYIRVTPRGLLVDNKDDLSESTSNTLGKIYYQDLHNKILAQRSFLINILLLQELCKIQDIQIINFQSFRDNFCEVEDDEKNYSLFQKINKEFWILGTMQDFLANENYATGKSGHTSAEGMRRWSQIIKEQIK